MPTMSSSFFQPAVTPCTALNTSARVRPCTAAYLSVARFTCKTPSLVSSEIPSATSADTLPLGPSTRTVLPSTLYFTPVGSGIGFFPIRDIESILMLACESRKNDRSFVPLQPKKQVTDDRLQLMASRASRMTGICHL